MAIRPTKQAWDAIRSEYLAGATATELAQRYSSVKAGSIHARAVRERWREFAIPTKLELSQYVVILAKATDISIDEASELEAQDQNRIIACHRAEVTRLGELLNDGLTLASEAAQQNNLELAKSAAEFISSIKEAAAAFYLKVKADRVAYGLDRCPSFSAFSDFENIFSASVALSRSATELKSEAL